MTRDDEPATSDASRPIGRRTMMAGAAAVWAVPVIAVATPAPAYAASGASEASCEDGTLVVETIDRAQAGGLRLINLTADPVTVVGGVDAATPHVAGVCGADSFQDTGPGRGVFSVRILGNSFADIFLLVVALERPGPTGFITLPGCGRYGVTSVQECPAA